jgi:hypothetical protein
MSHKNKPSFQAKGLLLIYFYGSVPAIMNTKHIIAGVLIASLAAPATIIAYETYGFSYQPTDPDQYSTVASVDERISELEEMIAVLEADRGSLIEAREQMLEEERLRSMILDLLDQVKELKGDTSDVPSESEQESMTHDETQQFINDLLAQIAMRQGDLSNSQPPTVCPFTWTRDLTIGDTGVDVLALQQFLNADPDTRLAVSGLGAPGLETKVYSDTLAEAVSKFQVKYRADVLSPQGLVNPTGNFDSQTRAKANSLCVPSYIPPEEPYTFTVRDTDGDGWIYGTSEDDRYSGRDDDEIMVGSEGNDIMYGGFGWDEVNYVGRNDCIADFAITENSNGSVTIKNQKYGTDTLWGMEGAYFAGCEDWVEFKVKTVDASNAKG